MARPRVSRPPDSRSREAACLARSTVLRSGPITTMVTSRTRAVTAAAADRAANGSTLRYTMRSRTPRLANGPSSARRAHSSRVRPSAPGVVVGSPTPTSMLAPPRRPSGCGAHGRRSWYGSGMRVGVIVLVVVAVLAATVGLLWVFQRRLLYFPTRTVPPAASVLPGTEEVTFDTADGLRLRGWFVPAHPRGPSGAVDNPAPRRPRSATLPEGAPGPAGAGAPRPGAPRRGAPRPGGPAVLVCNGNGGNRSMRAPLAAALARMGLHVLVFDYRGYGGNPGRPSEEGLADDARAALRYLTGRPEVDPGRVVLFGESLGAAVALRLAPERPPAGLVLRSPFTSLAEVGQVHYPWLPVSWLLRDRFDAAALVGRLDAPLLVVAGGRDRIVPVGHSRRLFAAAPPPRRLVVLEGADHTDLDLLAGPRLLDELAAFLAGVPGLRD